MEKVTLIGAGKIAGSGNDLDNLLVGNAAANTLGGGLGADTIVGGGGADVLVGGGGADHFEFDLVSESPTKKCDVIQDFDHSESDLID
ncbi:MAG: M10 family metallopeptidase C-terminal domain-containing protein, partial [bacterium]